MEPRIVVAWILLAFLALVAIAAGIILARVRRDHR